MTLISENFVRDDTKEGRIILTGLNVSIPDDLGMDPNDDQPDILRDTDLVVRADNVTITKTFKAPGRLVHIFARHVQCLEDATIDVSGQKGDPDYADRTRAGDGRNPGDNGAAGNPGGKGQDGGEIRLVSQNLTGELSLLAKGGDGGAAQDGGHGAKGKRGRNGNHNAGENTKHHADAGNGGRGGNGGLAGVPGKGGNGGSIIVAIYNDAAEEDQIKMDVSPGEPGAMATPGNAANGGDPGSPGTWKEKVCIHL